MKNEALKIALIRSTQLFDLDTVKCLFNAGAYTCDSTYIVIFLMNHKHLMKVRKQFVMQMCECMHTAHHEPLEHTIRFKQWNQENLQISPSYHLFGSTLEVLFSDSRDMSRLILDAFPKWTSCQFLHYLLKHGWRC